MTSPSNQFALLGQRRFGPFFWVQFLGADNDNLFKFAFTVLVTYQLQVGWLPPALAGLVIGALFILPFLLFSATSGQLADKCAAAGRGPALDGLRDLGNEGQIDDRVFGGHGFRVEAAREATCGTKYLHDTPKAKNSKIYTKSS